MSFFIIKKFKEEKQEKQEQKMYIEKKVCKKQISFDLFEIYFKNYEKIDTENLLKKNKKEKEIKLLTQIILIINTEKNL